MQEVTQGAGREERLPRGFGKQGGQVNRLGYVVKHKAEMRVGEKVLDVLATAGNKVIETDDIVALHQEAVREMGTQEARPAGDHGQRPEILAGQGI
jgi:hypothetical protein